MLVHKKNVAAIFKNKIICKFVSRSQPCECNNNSTAAQSTTVNPSRGNTSPNKVTPQCSCVLNQNTPGNYNEDSQAQTGDMLLSSNARFQSISAIAVSQDGIINIADQGKLI